MSSGPPIYSTAASAASAVGARCRDTPTEISIIAARMGPAQFQQLLKPLPKCSTLQRLEIADVGLHSAEADVFGQPMFRRERATATVHATVLATVLQCSSLVSLTLRDVCHGPRSTDCSFTNFLASMSRLRMLTELKLLADATQQVVPGWAKAMAASLAHMPQLQALSFNFIRHCISEDALAFTSALSSLSVLTALALSGDGAPIPWVRGMHASAETSVASSAWPKLLPALTSLTTLKHLSLSKLKLVSGAWEHEAEPITAAIHAMPYIEAVGLDWDNIWTADLLLAVLDALKAAGSCTKLVLNGNVIGWFDFPTSEVLDVAIAQACLLPSLHHLDMQCECNSILQAHHIAEQRDEFRGRLAKVQEQVAAAPDTPPRLTSLTHLAFGLKSSAARRIFYSVLPGMPALLQLHFSCFANKDQTSDLDDEITQLQAELCALAPTASLQELHLQFTATASHISQLSAALLQFSTLTCVEFCTLDEHGRGTRDRRTEPDHSTIGAAGLLSALTQHSGLKQLSLQELDLIESQPRPSLLSAGDPVNMLHPESVLSGMGMRCPLLVRLSLSNISPVSDTLSTIIREIGDLRHLEALELSLVAPSKQRHAESASELTEQLAKTLVRLVWLQSVTLGNIQLGHGGSCVRSLSLALAQLAALRHVELRCPGLTLDDYEAVASLLAAHTTIRSVATGLPGRPLSIVGLGEQGQTPAGAGTERRLLGVAEALVVAVGAAQDPLRCRDFIRRIKLGTRAYEYYCVHSRSPAPPPASLLSSSLLKGLLCCCAP